MAAEEIENSNPILQQAEDEKLKELKERLHQLYAIWNETGVDNEQQVNRANKVWQYLFDVLKECINEEAELYEDLKKEIRKYEKKIVNISTELNLSAGEEVTGSPLERCEALRQKFKELSKIKRQRLEFERLHNHERLEFERLHNHKRLEFERLRLLEFKYSEMLNMPSLGLSPATGDPPERDFSVLQQRVNMLQEEIQRRKTRFYMLRGELITILKATELTLETPLEEEILTSEEESLLVSSETFKKLKEIVFRTKRDKADLEYGKVVLMDKLRALWDELKIEKDEKEAFLAKHTDCRVSNLNAIKEEISRCEAMKRQNITKHVDALNEVARWGKYHKDTDHIFQKINKWQERELWKSMTIFENDSNDPERLKNGGGNLLQGEQERDLKPAWLKQLPALQNEIFLDIEKYEERTGKPFLYYGGSFRLFYQAVKGKKFPGRKCKNKS